MTSRSNREVVEEYIRALSLMDETTLRSLSHADAIFDWPQTRERIKGVAAMRAIDQNYPGGLPNARPRRVLGVEDRWVVDPMFVPRRVSGSGDVWIGEADFTYPDGSTWAYCLILELRDGRIARTTEYWAPRTPAPEWRAEWVTPMPEDD